jgi:SNF2 family DNA or RNA helicase
MYPLILHQYQKDAVQFLLGRQHAGIFADPGLGKTLMVLQFLKIMKMCKGYTPCLIVAPLRVIYSVWPQEIRKWNYDLSVCNLHSEVHRKADIYTINPESLVKLLQKDHQYKILVIDESTRFKSPKSKRFKAIKKYLDSFERRIILTGTPTPNGLLDLFSQIYLLDQGETLGKYITHFRHDYFYPTGYMGYEWKLLPNSQSVVEKKIKPMITRIDASTYLDLPDLIFNDVFIELPDETQKFYRDIEKKLFAELDDNPIIISTAASAYNACRQIANGGLFEQLDPSQPIPIKRKVYGIHDEKDKAAQSLVDELWSKPVLIAYHYKHDLHRLKKLFPNAPVIGSGVSAKRSDDIIKKWNARQIPILLGHPKSMGHGLNMQAGGNDIIWYALTDSLEDYDQFNRRIYRQGVKGQVRIHRIIARHTVDEALVRMIDRKSETQQALLNALKEYRYGRSN